MKICFVLGTLKYSGAEKIVRYLMNELIKKDYNVSVILLSCSNKYEELNGIHQFPLFNKEEEKKDKIIRVIKRIKRIRRIIVENKFDLVISFGVKFNLDVSDAVRGTNTKLILCERNDPKNDPASLLLRLRRKINYNIADGYVFQTKEIQEFFNNRIQKKSIVIPNFIECCNGKNIYNPSKKSIATSARLDINQKDQLTLFRAFKLFSKSHPEYTLELYGDGPDREKLEKFSNELGISNVINFNGQVENPIKEIVKSKAFILTSKYEGMPNALIEAMAAGMPCISTKCSGGGAEALIKDNKNGILTEVGDYKKIALALKRICEDKEFANMLGKNAYKINEELNLNNIINMWERYFKKVIKLN